MNFKMRLASILGILILSGCDDSPTPGEKALVEAKLPPGCELIDLGEYGEIDRLVIVRCQAADTVSTTEADIRQVGKTTQLYLNASFVVEE